MPGAYKNSPSRSFDQLPQNPLQLCPDPFIQIDSWSFTICTLDKIMGFRLADARALTDEFNFKSDIVFAKPNTVTDIGSGLLI